MEHEKLKKKKIDVNDSRKLVTRKWNIVNDLSNTNCEVGNEIVYKKNF